MKFLFPVILTLAFYLPLSCGDESSHSGGGSSSNKEEHDHSEHDHGEDATGETSDQAMEENEDGPDDPPPPAGDPNVVEFRIADGTGNKPWNTAGTIVTVPMGKTLRIINDDASGSAVAKRLHTNGSPCGHFDKNIPVGGFADCVVSKSYSAAANGVVYNHNVGPAAQFFLKTAP